MKSELMILKDTIRQTELWQMNMVMPENCTNTNCSKIRDWISVRGASDHAADMGNFHVANESNVSMNEIDMHTDMFMDYEN